MKYKALVSRHNRFEMLNLNHAITKAKPYKKNLRTYSFLLWNGDIHVIKNARSIRTAYIKIRDFVDPDLIAFIFPYAPPLPMMIHTDGCFYYYAKHPAFKDKFFFPLQEETKSLYLMIFGCRRELTYHFRT